ncbi:MAG: ornithine carbamoyltransferase [Chloroflexi bacterium]|nr:ornithine carbamoyltransferase [Chloroflexota bacterium]
MLTKDLISILDLEMADAWSLLNSAIRLKRGPRENILAGKTVAMIFEKPSLRTRVSFDLAMYQLGGHTVYLSPAEVGLGQREPVRDVAGVLSRYADGIVARTFSQAVQQELAKYSSVPVINALSDQEHPCQALGDFLTVYEKKGALQGLTLCYVGDGNNVANSLLLMAALVGVNFRIACPPGYEPDPALWDKARRTAAAHGSAMEVMREPETAASGADILYTDVWVSMGQEEETAKRRQVFKCYQVNNKLLSVAAKEALLMHPMPVHHGEEMESALVYSPQSVLLDQAENRLHIQKAVLAGLLGRAGS